MKFIFTLLFVASCGLCLAQNLKLQHIRTFNGHSHGVRHVVFSPSGNTFASGGTRGELFIWDVDGEAALQKLEGHYGSITNVRYTKNGKYLISAGEDGQIKVWDAASGFCMQRIISPTSEKTPINKVNFALMSSQTETVYFGGSNRYVCQIPFKGEGEPEVIYTDKNHNIRCAILSPNGDELIFAAGKYLMALDLATGEVIREYNTGSCIINSLEFSDDGKRLLTWCENSRVDMRDPSNFYLLTSFRSGTGGNKFSNLAFTEDQKYVITGDHASRFNVWDLNNKQRVLDQGADQGTILSFDLENGPNYLLSGSLDKSIKLWKIVADIPVEIKGKKKKKPAPVAQVVTPKVEIIQYKEPIEDVPQKKAPVNTNVVLKTPEKIETYERPKPKDPITSMLPERKNNRRIKPIRQQHKLTMKSHDLRFEIWDAQVIDGDIVSIYIDDVCIVKEYSITAEKKTVRFNATGYNRVYLYLHAHNLGTIPPNTATMTISDGQQVLDIQLRSDLTGSAAVELLFED